MLELAVLVVVLAALLLWMAGGVQAPSTFTSPPITLEGVFNPAAEIGDTITVVSWNIAWGYGAGSEGTGGAKLRRHFDGALTNIGERLRTLGADVVLLQEIDFDATRSHHVDQAAVIARAAGLPYVARAVSWKANWVPFPYWPITDHFGYMRSGGAILSRFPIRSNTVELLPKPTGNPFWFNLFYLFRYVQRAELDAGGLTLDVINTHLEAFSTECRVLHAEHLKRMLEAKTTPRTIAGGDLNTVPAEQPIRAGYPDEPQANHENDRTLVILRSVPGLTDVVSSERYRASPDEWCTFPASAPNRKLDYLFTGTGLAVKEVRVAREAGEVSDHLPLVVKLALNP